MYARITFERVEIGKVTQMPQQDDGHIDLSFFGFAFFRAQHDAVFLFDMDIVEIRHNTYDGDAAQLFDHFRTIGEEAHIAPKLIDQDAFDTAPVFLALQHDGAVHACKHAAPVNIGHEDDGRIGIPGHREVYEIDLSQVQLRDAPCSLHHDRVILCGQTIVGQVYLTLQLRTSFFAEVRSCILIAGGASVQHDLRGAVARRFEQERVHIRMARYAGGFGLYGLRASELQPVGRHERVECHILCFKRSRTISVLQEYPAESGRNHTFPDIASGAGKHHGTKKRRRWFHILISGSKCT